MQQFRQNFFISLFLSILIISVGFVGFSIGNYLETLNKPIPLTSENFAKPFFVSSQQPSPENTISTQLVAEKLDLQRKVIRPNQGYSTQELAAIVEQAGGQIIEQTDDVVVTQLPAQQEEEILAQIEQSPSVSQVEVDYPIFISADSVSWGITKIAAPEVWPITQANGVRVGVVDTGIDYNHPDLNTQYAGGTDTANSDTDPIDDNGHGTHVAGIIAANLNETGLVGASPQARLFGLKAIGADGSGYISDVVEAVNWAMTNDLDVLNFSIATDYRSQILEDVLAQAQLQGMTLVAAAGNTNGGAVQYPAAFDSVISVAASDSQDNLASFSSIGAEVSAPGVDITSTIPGGATATWSGTSMAAPHVSATVAMMIANNQTNIREQLRSTAVDLGFAGSDSYYGYGRIDAKSASLGNDVQAPLISFKNPSSGQVVSGLVQISLIIQDENEISEASLEINGSAVKSWSQGPYQLVWDTTTQDPGEYVLVASATDNFGNLGQTKITVTIEDITLASPTPTPSVEPSPSITPTPSSATDDQFDATSSARRTPSSDQDDVLFEESEDSDDSSEVLNGGSKIPSQVPDEVEERLESIPDTTNGSQRNQRPEYVDQIIQEIKQRQELIEEQQRQRSRSLFGRLLGKSDNKENNRESERTQASVSERNRNNHDDDDDNDVEERVKGVTTQTTHFDQFMWFLKQTLGLLGIE